MAVLSQPSVTVSISERTLSSSSLFRGLSRAAERETAGERWRGEIERERDLSASQNC